jgi:hypothetical protein
MGALLAVFAIVVCLWKWKKKSLISKVGGGNNASGDNDGGDARANKYDTSLVSVLRHTSFSVKTMDI